MADQEQPDWLSLPSDLLELIGKRSRDAVTGLAAFRSVCRTWRAAVEPAPRLLLPRADSDPPEFVFPLARGWSIVVDARDASGHLSHLATGATAALPKLNAVRDSDGGGVITHLMYSHRPEGKPETVLLRGREMLFMTYLDFTDLLRFAVHVPPDAPVAAGMTIMMYHWMLGLTGMFFCHPGDAAWTKVEKPIPIGYGFFDFAYHDGKMFGMDTCGEMAVYDAATLAVLGVVRPPPATLKLANKMYRLFEESEEVNYAHLVALPSKLVLVRTKVKSSKPVAFEIFELGFTRNGLAWIKVRDAGNYELFLDGYHTTFRENEANGGTRIYYVDHVHRPRVSSTTAAYCYNMQDNTLECLYSLPEGSPKCSTKPSWFVP